MALREIYTVSD